MVFKMKDEQTGKLHAVKCFLKEQEGRTEAYRLIAEELEYVSSTFLTPIRYLDKELFVDSNASDETEFPVLLMDWVEGLTLDKYIREHIYDEYQLSLLAYQFSRLAMWLMPQPFAHGDLKPDNILVRDDGTLVLVDYDGMYVPAMKGQKARELGSPDFRHPSRTEDDFDEHIDDFSIASILLSLKAIALQPSLLEKYGASDRLLFSEKDYHNISQCDFLNKLYPSNNTELNILMSLFILALEKENLSDVSFRLFYLERPKESEISDDRYDSWAREMEEKMAPYETEELWSFDEFVKKFSFISFRMTYEYYSITEGGEDALLFRSKDHEEITVFNLDGLTKEEILSQKNSITIELRKSGHYIICGYSTKVLDKDVQNSFTDEQGVMYSEDRKKLLGICNSYLPEYEIAEGTEIICDDTLNGIWTEIEGLMIYGTITIPSSVRLIGRNPFRGDYDKIICKSPHFVVENGALYTSDKKRLISCFTKESTFVVPNGVEQIGSFAFYDCEITRIIIPESVSYIGDNPFIEVNLINKKPLEVICYSPFFFINNNSLYKKKPKELVSHFGRSSFLFVEEKTIMIRPFALWCNAPKYLFLPSSIEKMAEESLYGSTGSLKQLLIPEKTGNVFKKLLPNYTTELLEVDLSKIRIDEYGILYDDKEKRLLCGRDIEKYSINGDTKEIYKYAFSNCSILSQIYIPNSINIIGQEAFKGCEKLEKISIPNSVTYIGKSAFRYCTTLNDIKLSNSITIIEESLFDWCVGLTNIVIPDSVRTIGSWAFSNCRSLTTITFSNSVMTLGDSIFFGCDKLTNILIPKGTRRKYEVLLSKYKEILVEQED